MRGEPELNFNVGRHHIIGHPDAHVPGALQHCVLHVVVIEITAESAAT